MTTNAPQGEATPRSRVVAAFDFDGTLTTRDTLVPFLAYATSRRRLASAVGRDLAPVLAEARRRGLRDAGKERLLARLFAGEEHERLVRVGEAYADRLHARLRPSMLDRIEWHRSQGHELVIVSASLHYYLDPLGERLGFDEVIAVSLEVDEQGRLTGRLAGPNVRGEEKVVRLRSWMGDDPDELWAYGDSSGDAHLLAAATHPHPVTRRARRYVERRAQA